MGKPRQFFVWVKPSSPSSIPGDVLMMIKALTQEIRSKFLKDHDDEKAGGKGGGKKRHKSSNASAESSEDLIFVSVADVEEEGLIFKIKPSSSTSATLTKIKSSEDSADALLDLCLFFPPPFPPAFSSSWSFKNFERISWVSAFIIISTSPGIDEG